MKPFTQKLRLIYFDMPARAEAIRMALQYGQIPWEDVHLSRSEFAKQKAENKFAFDQLPALEIPEKNITIFQSAAILRYVGQHCGLYPRDNPELAAVIDSLVDQHNDMLIGLNVSRFPVRYGLNTMSKDQMLQMRKELSTTTLPNHFRFFNNFLQRSSTGWLASTPKPTIADFAIVPRLEMLRTPQLYEGLDHTMLDKFPLILEFMKRLYQLPEIQEYYSRKPFDPRKQ